MEQLLTRMCLFHCRRHRIEFRFIARFPFILPNEMCVYFVVYAVTPLQIILMGQNQKKKMFCLTWSRRLPAIHHFGKI